jgi:DNA polymerase alpha subunit A
MAARAARLKQLADSRKNKASRSYEIEEYQSVYDTVDEEGYKKVVRSRLDRDDFVVDDNGEGYADDGREEDWEEGHYDEDASGDEAGDGQPRGKAGMIRMRATHDNGTDAFTATKKREEDQKKREKIRNGINQYFTAKTITTAPKAKVHIYM